MSTQVDIISGFLGAGKTTLIKKLLKEALAGTKVVLIENEFGEIGIDGGFLQEAGIEIREMNAGCICCSLVGDFGTSLKEVMDKYAPERILIEPSGVGKLSDVMNAIQNVADETNGLELNAAVTVIDCMKAQLYIKNFGEFITDQLENAGTIILTRTDKADDKKVEEVAALVRTYNQKATIITTPLDELDGRMILDAFEGTHDLSKEILAQTLAEMEGDEEECCCCHGEGHHHHHHENDEECCCHGEGHHHHHHEDDEECCCHGEGHHHHHEDNEECCCHGAHEHEHEHKPHVDEDGTVVHHTHSHEHGHDHGHHHGHSHGHDADEVFGSWGMETPHRYSAATIAALVAELENEEKYGFVLRAKGVVQDENGDWLEFDHVPEESEVRLGARPDVTGKIVVIGSRLNEEALEKLFREK